MRKALVLAMLLLIPGIAGAQQIGGTVTDTTGGVLPGVTVEARSPALIEQVRTAVTDGNGQYLIVALEVGTYDILYSLPGFGSLLREGVVLNSGFTANIDIQLGIGDIEETITVSGATPVVDIQNVEQRQVMDREVIDSIPTGKSFQSYALLVPGMGGYDSYLSSLSQDQGGIAGQTLQRLAIHGGNQEDQQLEINGMDVGDSLTQGANYSVFPDSNFEELAYNYSASPAEIESGGVRINMIPREGRNDFSGHFFTTFAFAALNSDNVTGDADLLARNPSLTPTLIDEVWTINPVVGGPIVRDRVWFFATHTSQKADTIAGGIFHETPESLQDPLEWGAQSNFNDPAIDATTIREQSVNFTIQASQRDKFKLYWTNSSTDQPYLLQGRTLASIYVSPAAAIGGVIRTNTYQATWTRPHTNRLLFEAGASMLPVLYQLHPTATANLDVPGALFVPGTTATRNMARWFGATERNSPKHTHMARASVSYVTGSHNMKFGMTGLWLGENAINSSHHNWYGILASGGNPILATFYTPSWQINRARNMGIYVQEQWTLDRLTINAGVRYDYEESSYPDQTTPASLDALAGPGVRGSGAVNTWLRDDLFIAGDKANGWHDLQPPGRPCLGRARRRPDGSQVRRAPLRQAQLDRHRQPPQPRPEQPYPDAQLGGLGLYPDRRPRTEQRRPDGLGRLYLHRGRRLRAGQPAHQRAERRAEKRQLGPGVRPAAHHDVLRRGLALRLGQPAGELGDHREHSAATGRRPVARRRLLPPLLDQLLRGG